MVMMMMIIIIIIIIIITIIIISSLLALDPLPDHMGQNIVTALEALATKAQAQPDGGVMMINHHHNPPPPPPHSLQHLAQMGEECRVCWSYVPF
jgi:hypothetical protein